MKGYSFAWNTSRGVLDQSVRILLRTNGNRKRWCSDRKFASLSPMSSITRKIDLRSCRNPAFFFRDSPKEPGEHSFLRFRPPRNGLAETGELAGDSVPARNHIDLKLRVGGGDVRSRGIRVHDVRYCNLVQGRSPCKRRSRDCSPDVRSRSHSR